LAQYPIWRSLKKRKQNIYPYWRADKYFLNIQYPTKNAGSNPAFFIRDNPAANIPQG
jgi:hypothetical protein